MFYLMFVDYLVQKKVITPEQGEQLAKNYNEVKIPIGALAVKAGYLTLEQADTVNTEQSRTDKRFGEIVVSKGFMDEKTFMQLLKEQSNDAEIVTRAISEAGIITKEEIQKQLESFQNDLGISTEQFSKLTNNEVDSFIEYVCKTTEEPFAAYFSLFTKTVIRFIDRQVKLKVVDTKFDAPVYITKQVCYGSKRFITGLFSDNKEYFKKFGYSYAKSLHIPDEDIDSEDAVCELINCINGLLISHFDKQNEDYSIEVVENAFEVPPANSKMIEVSLPSSKVICFVSIL